MGEEMAISDKKKKEMFRRALISINSSDNRTNESKGRRNKKLYEHPKLRQMVYNVHFSYP